MDGFVDRLHALRFLRACDPSYGALTFTLVGLPPTGYISLLLDILFGSFLPSLWSSNNQSLLESREPTLLCNQVGIEPKPGVGYWTDRPGGIVFAEHPTRDGVWKLSNFFLVTQSL